MNHMLKSVSVSVAALLCAGVVSSAMAMDGVTFSGDVHSQTSYQFRGEQFSDGSPSLGVKAHAAHVSGLYGQANLDTIKLVNGKNHFQGALTGGYATSLHGIKVKAGLSRHLFLGGDGVSEASFTEAFAAGEHQGLQAKVSTVVDRAKMDYPGFQQGDVYGELGYTYQVGKYSIGGDVGYRWLDSGLAKDGLALAQVRVGYKIDDKADLVLTHQFAGDDITGETATGTHKTAVAVSYKF